MQIRVFEGIARCYMGSEWISKHLYLLILMMLGSAPSLMAEGSVEAFNPNILFFGIVGLIANVLYGFYYVKFLHNSLKFFIWEEKQPDKAKVNAMEVMPNVDGNLFSHFWSWAGFVILWWLLTIALVIVICLPSIIPGIGPVFSFLLGLVIFIPYLFSMQYIFIGFSKNFEIGGNVNPILIFKYFPKIVLPTIILILLAFVMWIAMVALLAIPMFLVGLVGGFTLGADSLPFAFELIAMVVFGYLATIMSFGFAYAASAIYYEKIECGE